MKNRRGGEPCRFLRDSEGSQKKHPGQRWLTGVL